MDRRLFPSSLEFFRQEVIISVLEGLPGRDITSFSLAVLFVLRTEVSWRDLPSCFGNWHTVYTRFKHVRENGLFWSLLYRLQQTKKIKMDLVWIDSTTVNLHRHGSGVLKNKTLNWTGKKGLKHSRSMWPSLKGSFAVLVCLQAISLI